MMQFYLVINKLNIGELQDTHLSVDGFVVRISAAVAVKWPVFRC